jgi:fibronectin-binding autotransporter adhesin
MQIGDGGASGDFPNATGDATASAVNNGTLKFNRNNSYSTGKTISGSGAVVQSGSGTTILTGNSTYTGTTTINAGTLQVGNGGTTGALGTNAIVDNATLAYNLSSATTVALPFGAGITGSGSLTATAGVIQFNGNTTLGGSQSYTQNGGASLYKGLEVVGANVTLTGSAITLTGDVGKRNSVGNNLTLDTSSVNGPINLNASFGRNNVWYNLTSFTANAGTGAVNVTGTSGYGQWDSPVSLTGAINISANVGLNNTLTLNTTAPGTVSGVLSGASSLTKLGSATLTLTATNTHSGTVIISAGTLEIGGAGKLGSGNITDNATLLFNSSAVQTYGGAISGSGALVKNSTGTLTLSSSGSTYSGATTVNNGTLEVTAGAKLGTSTNVNVDGGFLTLQGGTAIDAITNAASLRIATGGKVHLPTSGANETVRELYLDGTRMYKGTWGSSSSPASYTNDTYFSGFGVITVSEGAPHPATVVEFR